MRRWPGLSLFLLIVHLPCLHRESVVQATKSARNSAIRYYVGILVAVLFFGGFFARSYWEDHVFKRDTARLLRYYKHVIPGSVQDGDYNNARYQVWKYRNKKEKLWKTLETKYGEPVLNIHEYKDEGEDEDEAIDLDSNVSEEEKAEKESSDKADEPDL
jgi:hypothetical protein